MKNEKLTINMNNENRKTKNEQRKKEKTNNDK